MLLPSLLKYRQLNKNEAALELFESLDLQIKNRMKEIGIIPGNANTKGGNYENEIMTILRDYTGSRFDFHNRAIR
jgi:hypothetical protein